jgi:membrane dipeptidase
MDYIIDFHCDLPFKVFVNKEKIEENNCNWSFAKLPDVKKALQIFAFCCEEKKELDSFVKAREMINTFSTMLEGSEVKNKVKTVYALEGGNVLEEKLEHVEHFYNLGIRIITLTWNHENCLGYGAVTGINKGLKPFGKEVIKEMNRLKMIVDTSHLNEAGFYQAAELSKIPIIASHSNSRHICNNLRNITDEQFEVIKNKGGIVGINAYPWFLNNTENAKIKDMISHIEYFLSLGGENTVVLGCDLDGTDCMPIDFNDLSDYTKLYEELIKLNYPEKIIAKLFYENGKNYLNKHIFEFF